MQCTCTEGHVDPRTGIQSTFPVIETYQGSQHAVPGRRLRMLSSNDTSVHERHGMCEHCCPNSAWHAQTDSCIIAHRIRNLARTRQAGTQQKSLAAWML